MKPNSCLRVAFFILIAVGLVFSSRADSMAGAQDINDLYLPFVTKPGTPPPPQTGAIIVDHTTTDIDAIPNEWILAARQLVIHYAHTSHGSQITTGLTWLEQQNSFYNVDIVESTTPQVPGDATALRIYDGTQGDTYVEPGDYWEGDFGKGLTRSVVGTGWFDFSQWSWCGQATYYSDAQINEYLSVMSAFETEYPAMRFILMTGHTEQPVGDTNRHNDMIRQYAIANDMVLFDFADIESYYPDGTPVPAEMIDDSCPWCQSWCENHPGDCIAFEQMGGCAHVDANPEYGKLLCSLKAQAYWYLMARLAGWTP